jgi:serine/threonine-protein kinase
MEYIEGTDLNKLVQLSGPLPIADACEFIRQVASGLQHAHQYGLVHRDIKPANLFLLNTPGQDKFAPGASWKRPADPIIKIIDWGLARIHDDGAEAGAAARGPTDAEKGMLIGTADYVAPEQAEDPRLVDIRADIYSLGCTFYYLLSGQPPFPGGSLIQKLTQHRQAEPKPIRELRPDVPEELATILGKMLAKQRESRYQIPLGVSVPLRRFCQDAAASGANGRNGQAPKPASGPRPVVPAAPPSGYFKRST